MIRLKEIKSIKIIPVVILIHLALWMFSCGSKTEIKRPHDPWVFRSVLDEHPRMVTVALDEDIWVAYYAQSATLYKAWKGGVNFDGAVYTTRHGPQPTSMSHTYYINEEPKIEWFLEKDGERIVPDLQFKGHRFIDDQVSINFELSGFGQRFLISEIPKAIKRKSQVGLSRTFKIKNDSEVRIGIRNLMTSLESVNDLHTDGDLKIVKTSTREVNGQKLIDMIYDLWMNKNGQTQLSAYFHTDFNSPTEQIEVTDEIPAEPEGIKLINNSDCRACHNAEVKTVGPSYISIARKYNDSGQTISMLSSRIILGGSGIWGEAMMSPHPDLDKSTAEKMVSFILSLDDKEKGNEKEWHVGQKTVPLKFSSNIDLNSKAQPGLAAYFYVLREEDKSFDMKGKIPVKAAIAPQIHMLDKESFGEIQDYFGIIFKGNLNIKESGSYSFRLISDMGSFLYIDNQPIIEFPGKHGTRAKDGEIYLTEGKHKIELHYSQDIYKAFISFQWFNKESGKFELVPESMLSTSDADFVATQKFIPEEKLLKTIPGDRRWLDGVHPAFDLYQARPDDFQPRIGGIDFLSEDAMVICTWDSLGPVYRLDNFRDKDPSKIKVTRIASGLAEPLGIKVVDGEIYVLQKQELTKLIDHDADGIIDEYQTVSDDWKVSANFHEFAFGLAYKDGYFYGALATAILPGGASAKPQIPDRGKVVKISRETGEVELIASGLRTPNGIGIGVDNEVFVADNQGDWLPANKINHVREGAWFGSRSVDYEGTEGMVQDEPVVWLTQDEIGNSPSTPLYMDKGPYAGQMIHCEVTHGGLKRVFVEKINGNYQGAVFRFSQGLEAGINRLAWAPDGSLLAGGIGVSGNWGQIGKLGYGLQRLVYNEQSVFEMLKVKAKTNGFEIEFTEPIKEGQNIEAEDFLIEQYYFQPTENYGGPKMGLEQLHPKGFYVSEDRRSVSFELDGLKKKHVVYFRIQRPFMSELDHQLWITEAWYTLTNIPENDFIFSNDYSAKHNQLTELEVSKGWKLLFDGKTTSGLRNYLSNDLGVRWKAENGTLHYLGKGDETKRPTAKGGEVVITDKPYKNFELSIDWKISTGGNSGIIYHVVEDEKHSDSWKTGPEYQLLDNVRHKDGKIEKHRSGDMYDLISTKFVTVNPTGEWNRTRIKIVDGKLEHWLNGYKVVEADLNSEAWRQLIATSKFGEMEDFGRSKEGHIVLQDHGDEVWFKNIKIKELK